jgi:hypothetical protein
MSSGSWITHFAAGEHAMGHGGATGVGGTWLLHAGRNCWPGRGAEEVGSKWGRPVVGAALVDTCQAKCIAHPACEVVIFRKRDRSCFHKRNLIIDQCAYDPSYDVYVVSNLRRPPPPPHLVRPLDVGRMVQHSSYWLGEWHSGSSQLASLRSHVSRSSRIAVVGSSGNLLRSGNGAAIDEVGEAGTLPAAYAPKVCHTATRCSQAGSHKISTPPLRILGSPILSPTASNPIPVSHLIPIPSSYPDPDPIHIPSHCIPTRIPRRHNPMLATARCDLAYQWRGRAGVRD